MKVEVITLVDTTSIDKLILSDNPEMVKRIRDIMRKVLKAARTRTSKDARSELSNDPRKAYMAVKSAVYKSLLGGNISILAKRRASSTRVKLTKRRLVDEPGHRGGNRRQRNSRTEAIDSYYGGDRGFILRFLNSGTDDRQTRYGNRGRISARNWFGNASQRELEMAAEEFTKLIEEELAKLQN